MSRAKEVFFINFREKFFRGIGIGVCILLVIVFAMMFFISFSFDSASTVKIFGFDVFVCESSDYDTVPSGSAVIATKCEPYDLESGNLVLYSTDPMNSEASLALGYYSDFKVMDGIYYLSLVNGTDSTVISETALIGKAGWCSPALGWFITFMKTPWGVFVMSVIPCLLLLVIDLVRIWAAKRPVPEVVPQLKNSDEPAPEPQFSVRGNGSAVFSRSTSHGASADSVLFTYNSAPKKKHPAAAAPTMSDKDVLSLLNAPSRKAEADESTPSLSHDSGSLDGKSAAKAPEKPTLPAPVAAKRYIDNVAALAAKTKAEDTAELTVTAKSKKSRSDAFFAQSEAPQIGKGLTGKQSGKSIIDLEDALAAAPPKARAEGSRRSADILASKNRSDLMAADDDTRDKSRYEVDDILAGLERRHREK